MAGRKLKGVIGLCGGMLGDEIDQYVAHIEDFKTGAEFVEEVNRAYDREARPEDVEVRYCRWNPGNNVSDYDYYLTFAKERGRGVFLAWFIDIEAAERRRG